MGKNKIKNKLSDLNNHLFEQLERLNDEELKGDALKEEIGRAKAIQGVAHAIVNNAGIALKAAKIASESLSGDAKMPQMLVE